MALMERVAMLLRADVTHLMDRAENPEEVLRQLVLDMQNQLLQVKTQVAIALADQHLLVGRAREQETIAAEWHQVAALAVSKGDDAHGRAALGRALRHETVLTALRAQVANQATEAEAVRASYAQLLGRLAETQARCDVLLAEPRGTPSARGAGKSPATAAGEASARTQVGVTGLEPRLREDAATVAQAQRSLGTADPLAEPFEPGDTAEQVERLLADLKRQQGNLRPTG